eukprot:g83360.t1
MSFFGRSRLDREERTSLMTEIAVDTWGSLAADETMLEEDVAILTSKCEEETDDRAGCRWGLLALVLSLLASALFLALLVWHVRDSRNSINGKEQNNGYEQKTRPMWSFAEAHGWVQIPEELVDSYGSRKGKGKDNGKFKEKEPKESKGDDEENGKQPRTTTIAPLHSSTAQAPPEPTQEAGDLDPLPNNTNGNSTNSSTGP